MAKYIDDDELVYEIILSKGKGFLTEKAAMMMILIAKNFIRRKRYNDDDDRKDAQQEGLLNLLLNWEKFNEKKYTKALPYYTELLKRSFAMSFNQTNNKNLISIESFMENNKI